MTAFVFSNYSWEPLASYPQGEGPNLSLQGKGSPGRAGLPVLIETKRTSAGTAGAPLTEGKGQTSGSSGSVSHEAV